jgi:hypothetical protein
MEASQTQISNTFFENPQLISNTLLSMSNNQINYDDTNRIIYPNQTNNSNNINYNQNYNNQSNNNFFRSNNTGFGQTYNSNFNQTNFSNFHQSNNLDNPNYNFLMNDMMKLNPNNSKSIKPFINNFLFSKINLNDIQSLPEENIIQLVNILQNITKNSLNDTNYFLKENNKLNNQINSISSQFKNNNLPYNNNFVSNNEINTLLKKNKEQEKIIQSYREVLKGKKNNNILIDDEEDEKYDVKKSKSKTRYYCQFCANKKFYTEQFLEDHMRRRHMAFSEQYNLIQKKNLNKNKLFNETKNSIEKMIINYQIKNQYNHLNEKLYNLEKKISPNEESKENQKPNFPKIDDTLIDTILRSSNKNNNKKNKISMSRGNFEQNDEEYKRKHMKLKKQKIEEKRLEKEYKQYETKKLNEMSALKIENAYLKSKKNFDSLNFEKDDTPYISLLRRSSMQNSLIKSQNNTLRNSFLKVTQTNKLKNHLVSNSTMKNSQLINADNNNNESILLNNNNIEPNILKSSIVDIKNQSLIDSKISQSIIIDDDNNLKGQKISNSNINEEIEQTEEEKELQQFYKKFVYRDRNYNGNLNNYIIKIIPDSYEISDNKINEDKENSIKNLTMKDTNNSIDNPNYFENYKNEQLIDLINKININMGEESEKKDNYGFYSKNLDEMLDIKDIIDDATNIFYQNNKNRNDDISID